MSNRRFYQNSTFPYNDIYVNCKTNKHYYYVVAVKDISNSYMVPCNTPYAYYEPN